MPVLWDLPPTANVWDQQSVDQFNKLPVWMAMQQVNRLEYYSRWRKKYKKLRWKPNMGSLLQSVIAEPSPITKQSATPRNITEIALRTQVSHYERSNSGRIKWQKFESPQFNFLPSFQDFRTQQIPFATEDLMKQIAVYYDNFIRWQALQQAPFVYVVNNVTNGEGPYIPAVYGEATDTSSPKDAGWFANMLLKVGAGSGGYLDYKQICALRDYAEVRAGIVPWAGMPGTPGENEVARKKYMLTGEKTIYSGLAFDQHILANRPLAMNLLNSTFSGVISDNVNFLEEFYPMRFLEDGTFPQPEIEVELPALTYGATARYEVMPYEPYTSAPGGIAFFEGNEPFEDLEIGPPPAPFNQKNLSMDKFVKMRWNGEVTLTDNLLTNLGSNQFDTNKYGEYLQLIATCTMGIIAKTSRYCLPVIYRRKLGPSLTLP